MTSPTGAPYLKALQEAVAGLTEFHLDHGSYRVENRTLLARHAFAPGDSYRNGHAADKFCPGCQAFKPLAQFAADNGRSGELRLKSWCRECSHKSQTEWRRKNRDHYNAKQREGRSRRAAAD